MNATIYREKYEGCPLCGASGLEIKRELGQRVPSPLPNDLTWMRCSTCEHVHTREYWNDAGRRMLFEHAFAEQVFAGTDVDQQRLVWSRVINELANFLPADQGPRSGRWVDVGSGNGGLVHTAIEFGYNAVGLELRDLAIDRAKAYGVPLIRADAMRYDYRGAAVVVLADILEHVPYPADLLRRVREGLVGPLFVSCPNADSATWRKLDADGKNFYWQETEHFHNFTRARLYALLDSCGFTPRRYSVSQRYQACMEIIAT